MAAPMDGYRIRLGPAVTAVQEGCGRLWRNASSRGSLRASDDCYSGHRPNSSQLSKVKGPARGTGSAVPWTFRGSDIARGRQCFRAGPSDCATGDRCCCTFCGVSPLAVRADCNHASTTRPCDAGCNSREVADSKPARALTTRPCARIATSPSSAVEPCLALTTRPCARSATVGPYAFDAQQLILPIARTSRDECRRRSWIVALSVAIRALVRFSAARTSGIFEGHLRFA
jgi:hypothetical protein